jgi:hypothetical protein
LCDSNTGSIWVMVREKWSLSIGGGTFKAPQSLTRPWWPIPAKFEPKYQINLYVTILQRINLPIALRILISRLDVFGHCLDVLILISLEQWHVNIREQYNPKIYM